MRRRKQPRRESLDSWLAKNWSESPSVLAFVCLPNDRYPLGIRSKKNQECILSAQRKVKMTPTRPSTKVLDRPQLKNVCVCVEIRNSLFRTFSIHLDSKARRALFWSAMMKSRVEREEGIVVSSSTSQPAKPR